MAMGWNGIPPKDSGPLKAQGTSNMMLSLTVKNEGIHLSSIIGSIPEEKKRSGVHLRFTILEELNPGRLTPIDLGGF